jgi:hypothetical protein
MRNRRIKMASVVLCACCAGACAQIAGLTGDYRQGAAGDSSAGGSSAGAEVHPGGADPGGAAGGMVGDAGAGGIGAQGGVAGMGTVEAGGGSPGMNGLGGSNTAGGSSVGGSSVGGSSVGGSSVGVAGSSAAGAASGAPSGGASGSELIDDFEDQDGFILLSHKRNGPWYVFNDGTIGGMESPFTISALTGANARAGSNSLEALHLTGSGFTGFGLGVGADFVNTAAKKVPYDVSAYKGIQFYAKIASGTTSILKLLIPTTYSDPDGGQCSGTGANQCDDHLFFPLSGLKTTWDLYQVNFSALAQVGFGLKQSSLDPTSVYSLQFVLSTKPLPVDIWLDDIAFVVK